MNTLICSLPLDIPFAKLGKQGAECKASLLYKMPIVDSPLKNHGQPATPLCSFPFAPTWASARQARKLTLYRNPQRESIKTLQKGNKTENIS